MTDGKKEQIFEKGLIKVAWVEKSNKILYSKMFNSLDEALKFSKNKKDYLIFKLIKQKGLKEFKWEILDYGRSKEFTKLVKYEKKFL